MNSKIESIEGGSRDDISQITKEQKKQEKEKNIPLAELMRPKVSKKLWSFFLRIDINMFKRNDVFDI